MSANRCSHPPLADVEQLLICRKCHAAKVVGVLKKLSPTMYFLDGTLLTDIVDPALVGKRVRVIIEEVIEAVPVDEDAAVPGGAEEFATDN